MKKVLTSLQLIREAGCTCKKPQLAEKENVGPRCNLCDTQVRMVNRGAVG